MFFRNHILLVAGIPLAAFVMYEALKFLIYTCAPDLLAAYPGWSPVAQLIWALLQSGVILSFNRLRQYCISECIAALGSPLPTWFIWLYLYAALCWLATTGRLLYILWGIPVGFSLDSVIELVFLSCGVFVMVGIAVPFCAGRLGVVGWYERRMRTGQYYQVK